MHNLVFFSLLLMTFIRILGLIISIDFSVHMKEPRYKLFIIGWFFWVTAGLLPILSDVVENELFQESLLVLNGINASLGALFIGLGIISYFLHIPNKIQISLYTSIILIPILLYFFAGLGVSITFTSIAFFATLAAAFTSGYSKRETLKQLIGPNIRYFYVTICFGLLYLLILFHINLRGYSYGLYQSSDVDVIMLNYFFGIGVTILTLLLFISIENGISNKEKFRAYDEVRKSEQRYRNLITTMSEGIWVTDLQNKTILVNPALEKMLGYSNEELLNYPVTQFLSVESLKIFEEKNSERFLKKIPSSMYELTFIQKNKRPLIARVAATVLLNQYDEPMGSFGVISDITLQKQLENERIDLESRRSEFISLTSHELRTPLTNIKGFIEVIRKKGEDLTQETKIKCFKAIDNNITRLERLIASVSELTRIEKGIFQLNLKEVDFFEFFDSILKPYELIIGKNINYVCHKIIDVSIEIDPQRLTQALDNIVHNAIEHTPDETREIMVNCEVLTDSIKIEVADNGAGIEPANLDRIFDSFVSFPTKYSVRGTGIGLFLAKTIIEAHNGTIVARSEGIDKGAIFTITIPRKSGNLSN